MCETGIPYIVDQVFGGTGLKDMKISTNVVPTNYGSTSCMAFSTDFTSAEDNITLYVPKGSDLSGSVWQKFGTIIYYTNPVGATDWVLVDGEDYLNQLTFGNRNITYTRTFTNTDWQALYVPFSMSYEDRADDFEVAAINDVHQWDDDDDGSIDRTALEVVKVKSGSIDPNTPYLIKAKTTGEKTITLSDATLYASEENTFDVSSWKLRFNFYGTYTGVTGATMLGRGYYAMGDGKLQQAESRANALSPMRWYMSVTHRQGNPVSVGLIKVFVSGDEDWDDAETAITNVNESDSEDPIYDLNGRRVEKAKKGLYIKNGKKVLVK